MTNEMIAKKANLKDQLRKVIVAQDQIALCLKLANESNYMIMQYHAVNNIFEDLKTNLKDEIFEIEEK